MAHVVGQHAQHALEPGEFYSWGARAKTVPPWPSPAWASVTPPAPPAGRLPTHTHVNPHTQAMALQRLSHRVKLMTRVFHAYLQHAKLMALRRWASAAYNHGLAEHVTATKSASAKLFSQVTYRLLSLTLCCSCSDTHSLTLLSPSGSISSHTTHQTSLTPDPDPTSHRRPCGV